MSTFSDTFPLITDLIDSVSGGLVSLAIAGALLSLTAVGAALFLRRSHPLLQNATLMAWLSGMLLLPIVLPALRMAGVPVTELPIPSISQPESHETVNPTFHHAEILPVPLTVSIQLDDPKEARLDRFQAKQIVAGFGLVWLAGLLFVLFRRFLGFLKLRRFKNSLSPVTDDGIIETWRTLAGDRHQDVVLLSGPSNLSPMVFGIFSPRVVLPSDLRTHLSSHQLRAVLAHELSHIQHRDALLGLVQSLVMAIYWWNPLVRFLLCRISLLREMISDEVAANHLHPADYAASLLRLADRATPSAVISNRAAGVSFMISNHPLEQRFKMLTQHFNNKTNHKITMKQTIAIYSSLLSVMIVCSTMQTTFAQDKKLPDIPPVPSTVPVPAPVAPVEPVELTAPDSLVAPKAPVAPKPVDHSRHAQVIAALQAQISQLRAQVERLSREKARTAVAERSASIGSVFADEPGGVAEVEVERKSKAGKIKPKIKATSSERSNLLIEGSSGERIELGEDGILKITSPDGETIRVDTHSGFGKAIGGVIEKSLEKATEEIEVELEGN